MMQSPLSVPTRSVDFRRRLIAAALFCLMLGRPTSSSAEEPRIDFANDIQPLLSDRCFTCHGPDGGQRATELRLDDPDSTYALAVVPGDAEASELLSRIYSTDSDIVMPPPESKLSLSDDEKQRLKRWVLEGAKFERHWSFVPPKEHFPVLEAAVAEASEELPPKWETNEIDFLVSQQLQRDGLEPSELADKATLLRRVTFDLIGLPPTPQELQDFVENEQPDAYQQVVERLLNDPRFGEHMAVGWLDTARYADTHGYQADRYRAMWPWRDWVIDAFNSNLSYDKFITWQVAGDLLPDATEEQVLATAFNRHHRQTNEGGSVEEEFRAEYVADRVNTFGAAFLGLTLECCRCHDHKYDPVSQQEYYQLSAFFNNIDESGLYSHFTNATPTPTLTLAEPSTLERRNELQAQLHAIEEQIRAPNSEDAFRSWREKWTDIRTSSFAAADTGVISSSEPQQLIDAIENSLNTAMLGDYSFDSPDAGKVLNRVTDKPSGSLAENPLSVPSKVNRGLQMSGENSVTIPEGGDFTRNQPFSVSLWINVPQEYERAVVFHRSRAWTDAASRGYELLIEEGQLSAALIHFWPGNAIRVRSVEKIATNRWTQVTMTYDGSSRADGLQIYVDGEAVEQEVVRDKLTRNIRGGEASTLVLGQRFRDVGLKDGQIDELRIFNRDLTPLEAKYLMLRDALPYNISEFVYNASNEYLFEYMQSVAPERSTLNAKARELREEISRLWDPVPEVMVMREMPEQRPTYILRRGAYDSPGERVGRDWPAVLDLPPSGSEGGYSINAESPEKGNSTDENQNHASFPAYSVDKQPTIPEQLNRLDLANWLIHPQHPLTARVAVNRFWQRFFGEGLVRTSEDFGRQGELPKHPELLDWLARDFINSDWNTKQLIETIVMSSTYRQSSNPTPELLEIDPENRLLARGPAVRLSAEMIRDSALRASGLLVEKLGGAPVKPYQPDGLWEEKSAGTYARDVGEGSHRRSLYTYWKRTSPPPSMMTFDASNREVCTVRRQVTITPLQTLVLLNDPQFVEAARGLAERAIVRGSTVDETLAFIFIALCSREPDEREAEILLATFETQRQYFDAHQEKLDEFLIVGDHKASEDVDRVDLGAYAAVAQGLMSFDEFMMKR